MKSKCKTQAFLIQKKPKHFIANAENMATEGKDLEMSLMGRTLGIALFCLDNNIWSEDGFEFGLYARHNL